MLLLLRSNVVVVDCGGKMHIYFFLRLKNELKNTLTVRCTRIQCMIVCNFALMSVETCFRFNSFFTNFYFSLLLLLLVSSFSFSCENLPLLIESFPVNNNFILIPIPIQAGQIFCSTHTLSKIQRKDTMVANSIATRCAAQK